MPGEKPIGKVSHYYTQIEVAVIELKDTLKVGDTIHIKGYTTDFKQKVKSMQIEHKNVDTAGKVKSIGLKTNEPVRDNDVVYKVKE